MRTKEPQRIDAPIGTETAASALYSAALPEITTTKVDKNEQMALDIDECGPSQLSLPALQRKRRSQKMCGSCEAHTVSKLSLESYQKSKKK